MDNFIHKKQQELFIQSNNINNVERNINEYVRFQNNIRVLSRAKYESIVNDIDVITFTKTGKERRKRELLQQFNSAISQFLSTTNYKDNYIYDFLYNLERKCKYYDHPAKSLKDTFTTHIQCGIDEAGRGPLFGRVYCAGCVFVHPDIMDWDNEHNFLDKDYFLSMLREIKDSKKYSSHKKIMEIYNFIKQFSFVYSIQYVEAEEIDNTNIRSATQKCMNAVMYDIREKIAKRQYNQAPIYSDSISLNDVLEKVNNNILFLVDGCDFVRENRNEKNEYVCIEGGDNMFMPIGAASILAKVSRDEYIEQMCNDYPYLREIYHMDKHKGYGTKQHLDAIDKYGISLWHRKTFGKCREKNIYKE